MLPIILLISLVYTLMTGFVLLVRTGLLVVIVYGESMAPTLHHGDRILVLRRLLAGRLRKGQIVVMTPPDGQEGSAVSSASIAAYPLVKRVVALPHESFAAPAEDNVRPKERVGDEQQQVISQVKNWQIPANHVFVCGDNRDHSVDSRAFGPLPVRNVLGIMLMRLAPVANVASMQLPVHLVPLPSNVPTSGLDVEPLPHGTTAPPLTAMTTGGETFDFASYTGQTLLLLFIAPTRLVRSQLPSYGDLAHKLSARQKIATIFVCDADLARTQSLLQELRMTVTVLVAPRETHSLWSEYRVIGTPFYCLIDPERRIQSCGFLSPSFDAWRIHSREHLEKNFSPGADTLLSPFPDAAPFSVRRVVKP